MQSLTCRKSDAILRIAERINAGDILLHRVCACKNETELNVESEAHEAWQQSTIDILGKIFSDTIPAKNFFGDADIMPPPKRDWFQESQSDLRHQIGREMRYLCALADDIEEGWYEEKQNQFTPPFRFQFLKKILQMIRSTKG